MNLNSQLLRTTFAAFVVVLASCSTSGSKIFEDHTSAHAGPADEKQKPKFDNAGLTAVYDHYVHIKNALVNSNAKEARLGAVALKSALNRVHNAKGAELANRIAKSRDLAAQRAGFDELSAEVENLIRSAKINSGIVYKKYCPMAQNGEGAYWLSGEAEIKNPYYGDEMLECGEVVEEIK